MGTHPIFESDFDCLTENTISQKMADQENNHDELKAQENQLRSKYGNAMLMKKLQGKNKQYFDSGDYNMKSGKKATNPMANPLAAKTVPSMPGGELPTVLRRESLTTANQPTAEQMAALQQRRGSQVSALALSNSN